MASTPTPVDPIEGHRLWAETYDADVNPLLALEQRVLQPHLDRLAAKRFVDIGCGTGRWLLLAREAGAEVIGLDLTRAMLAQAAAKPHLKEKLVCADAQSLPFAEATADVVLCSFCISYLEDPAALFGGLARITKPGGCIIVSDIHPAAAKAGWKRTFRATGQLYEMKLGERHKKTPLRQGLDAGLTLWRVLEPSFGKAELPLFEKAGKSGMFEALAAMPALLVTLWDRRE